MSIQQLLFATSSAGTEGVPVFDCLDFSQAGDSFTVPGVSGRAFCLGREPDYSYTSPNVIWATVGLTAFAKFECQNGTFTKVGGDIDSGFVGGIPDMTDTGTHIILISFEGEVNRYNKSTGSMETKLKDKTNRRGVAWKSPFFYTGSTTYLDRIDVFATQASYTTYQNIVDSTFSDFKGLVYDPEDDLFYQTFSTGNGHGSIFSTTNASDNTNSVSFTDRGTVPPWTNPDLIFSFDLLKNRNGKFIIGKNTNSGLIYCLYKLA